MADKLLQSIPKIIRDTVHKLMMNDPLRMAGATAFFTSFALPPIVMIIVRVLGLFLDRRTLGQQLSRQLSLLLGRESTESILQTIRGFRALQHNYVIAAGLFVFLLFVATTLFNVIKNSINQIWHIRRKPGVHILSGLQSRGLSLVVIILAGLLFLGVQLIDAGQHMLGSYFMDIFPKAVFYLGAFISELVIVSLSAIWFFAIFILLPDAKPHWKVAATGAFITSILFNLGKWVLQILLQPGQLRNFYGASGALVLVLLFVFYSSMILYFGAAFIKVWGEARNRPLRLNANASRYRVAEVTED